MHDRAIDDFTREIENDPDNADAYRSRSLAYAEKRDRDAALNDYNHAIELTKRQLDKDRWPE